jgi:hypothetical protein
MAEREALIAMSPAQRSRALRPIKNVIEILGDLERLYLERQALLQSDRSPIINRN